MAHLLWFVWAFDCLQRQKVRRGMNAARSSTHRAQVSQIFMAMCVSVVQETPHVVHIVKLSPIAKLGAAAVVIKFAITLGKKIFSM